MVGWFAILIDNSYMYARRFLKISRLIKKIFLFCKMILYEIGGKMKKLIYLFFLGVFLSSVLVGCGLKSANNIKKEVNIQAKIANQNNKNKEENKDYNVGDSSIKTSTNIVVIDPGHQEEAMNGLEPIGPGSNKSKPMLSSGTRGVVTGVSEYQLTLDVSLKLRDKLRAKGYKVVMIRENNHCPISNKGRAEIANKYKDGIFLRIHANAIPDQSVSGILTMCPGKNNPYTPAIVDDSRRLSLLILEQMLKSTGAENKGIIETNNMSGINWCKIPVSIIEMGFMSNPKEDKLLQTESYQNKLVEGIAKGVDKFFDI